jgi:hypothetical protein
MAFKDAGLLQSYLGFTAPMMPCFLTVGVSAL